MKLNELQTFFYTYNIYIKIKKMEMIKITLEAFEAFEKEAKIKYLEDMCKLLGDNLLKVQIGNENFNDRKSLQMWQIKNGFINRI